MSVSGKFQDEPGQWGQSWSKEESSETGRMEMGADHVGPWGQGQNCEEPFIGCSEEGKMGCDLSARWGTNQKEGDLQRIKGKKEGGLEK